MLSDSSDLRALTVRQPWAWAIVAGLKDIENRTWATRRRGRILIHAGRLDDAEALREFPAELPAPGELLRGYIIWSVELVDCLPLAEVRSRWAIGPCCFVLRDAERLEKPIRIAGSLKFWRPESRLCASSCTRIQLHRS